MRRMRLFGAGVIALGLSLGGGIAWSVLFRLNLRFSPSVPWSALAMGAIIAGVGLAFARSGGVRLQLPPAELRPRAALAAVAATVCALSMIILGLRIGHFDPDAFASSLTMGELTPSMRVARVLMAGLVAAFFEELGFRGVLLGALEQRFGARRAVVATSLLFYALHLFHGWTHGDVITVLAVAVPFVITGILFGALTVLTGSLAPAMVAHALVDWVALPMEWTGRHNLTPVTATGLDLHFATWLAALLVSSLAVFYSLREIHRRGSSI